MKEKIYAELKKQFSGLSNEFLLFLALQLEPKVADETKIEGAITELNNLLPIKEQAKFFQSEGDKRATEAAQTHEQTLRTKFEFKEKGKADPQPQPQPQPGANDEVLRKINELTQKLQVFEQKESKQKVNDNFIARLKEEKVPLSFAQGHQIESEDQIEAAITKAKESYAEVKQHLINEGFAQETEPVIGGTRDKDGVSNAVKSYVEAKSNPEKAAGPAASMGGKQI